MSLSSISILPEADKILGRKPQFTLDQFKPIARFTADPTVLVVRADAPWKTLAEFVADAEDASPAATTTAARATTAPCTCRWRCSRRSAGFRMTHIPYTGAGPAVLALLGGPGRRAVHRAGQRAGSTSRPASCARWRTGATSRWPSLPEVPSLKQLGQPVQFAQWSALFVPAGTPDAIVQKLRAAAKKAAADPQVVADDQPRRQPDRVPRRAGVPGLLGRRREADDRGGAQDRQGGVIRRPRASLARAPQWELRPLGSGPAQPDTEMHSIA